MKEFYPNIAYNKEKRKKFFIFFILTIIMLAALFSVCVIAKPESFITWLVLLGIMLCCLLVPGVMRAYPVKNVPIIQISNKTITYSGKYSVELKDVKSVRVNVMVDVISKIKPEIEEHLKYVANHLEEEEFFGDVDLVVKTKNGKDEKVYATVMDCVGALQALVDFGVKEYEINVFSGKIAVTSNYKIYKSKTEDSEQGIKLSKKERIKQLL